MSALEIAWMPGLYDPTITPDEVESLITRIDNATAFVTPEWFECAAAVLPPGRKLAVLALSRDKRLVGWIPFTLGTERLHGIPTRTLRLLGYPFSDRVVLPVEPDDPEAIDSIVNALVAQDARWDIAILSELPEGEQITCIEDSLLRRPTVNATWRPCARSPRLRLAFENAAALRKEYGRTLRTRLSRARRKLVAAGEVSFERRLATPEEAPDLVGLARTIEAASWKGRGGVGIFGTPIGLKFFGDVAVRFAARGWLDFGLLRLNGAPISYRFGFRFRGVFYDYNLAFEPAYAALSPGRILLDEMIVSSVEAGLIAVDASRSSEAEPHLLADWTTEAVRHSELWLYRTTVRARGLYWLRAHVRPALHRLRGLRSTPARGRRDG